MMMRRIMIWLTVETQHYQSSQIFLLHLSSLSILTDISTIYFLIISPQWYFYYIFPHYQSSLIFLQYMPSLSFLNIFFVFSKRSSMYSSKRSTASYTWHKVNFWWDIDRVISGFSFSIISYLAKVMPPKHSYVLLVCGRRTDKFVFSPNGVNMK